ncbi:hypothetical protein [Thaumasiovibrio subtropicus]|uniref:hypothetical protein n=1 Tax=Thaumasiovibrio subtropicus TaxID=1891207 RepID=UPI000B35F610|nr:hypothetical protein [Thaumasiovibrio subtropicus]
MPAKRYGTKRAYGMKANISLIAHAPVFLSAGLAVDFASATPADTFIGTATLGQDATGQPDNVMRVEVDIAETKFANSGDITPAHIGNTAYFIDANTLSLDNNGDARIRGGTITQVDDDGIWIAAKL